MFASTHRPLLGLAFAAAAVLGPMAVGCEPERPPIPAGVGGGSGIGPPASTADAGSPAIDGGIADAGGTDACLPDTDGDEGTMASFAIVEIAPGANGFLELLWLAPGNRTLDGVEVRVDDRSLSLPALAMGPGTRILLATAVPTDGEASVWMDGVLATFACWGASPPTTTQNTAVSRQIWLANVCAAAPGTGASLHLAGPGTRSTDFVEGAPSPSQCLAGT